MKTLLLSLLASAVLPLFASPVKVILDTDMLTDFDDVGALACLHALADAGECEILATVSCTRGNASTAAIGVINGYYGRAELPVGWAKGMGVIGAYAGDVYAGRAIAEMEGPRNPVKDVFAGNIPSREEVRKDPGKWRDWCFGMGGRAAWDETAVLAAVRGEESYFNVHRGTYKMIGDTGENVWLPDEENGPHLRITEKVNKLEVAKVIDELICRPPAK